MCTSKSQSLQMRKHELYTLTFREQPAHKLRGSTYTTRRRLPLHTRKSQDVIQSFDILEISKEEE